MYGNIPMKAIGSHIRQIASWQHISMSSTMKYSYRTTRMAIILVIPRTNICRLGKGGTVLLRSLVEGRVSLENKILLMVVIVGSAEPRAT